MDPSDRDKIQANITILRKFEDIEQLVNLLVYAGVIDWEFYERIKITHSFIPDRIQEFFLLYTRRGPQAFDVLVKSLKQLGYKTEAEKLEGPVCIRRFGSVSSLESPSESSNSSGTSNGSVNRRFTFESPVSSSSSPQNSSNSSVGLGGAPVSGSSLEEGIQHQSSNVISPLNSVIRDLKIEDTNAVTFEIKKALLYNQGKTDPKEVYPMMSNPRGFALIINNIEFQGDPSAKRVGAEVDSINLEKLLQELGFKVTVYQNLKKNEMINPETGVFKKFQDQFLNTPVDCCLMAIMSHGTGSLIRTTDSDRGDYHSNYLHIYNDIIYTFNNNNCPALFEKPKIFLVQACRGQNRDKGFKLRTQVDGKSLADIPRVHCYTDVDSAPYIPTNISPSNEDMLVCFSTVPGFVSNRDIEHGTWYIRLFCQTVAEHAHNSEIISILRKLDQKMRTIISESGEKQVASFKSIGFQRELYLNPGLYAEMTVDSEIEGASALEISTP